MYAEKLAPLFEENRKAALIQAAFTLETLKTFVAAVEAKTVDPEGAYKVAIAAHVRLPEELPVKASRRKSATA